MPALSVRRLLTRFLSRSPERGRRGRSFLRPCLEILENRTLLSVFIVTNTNDSGMGSLRQAILDANASPGLDTIAFQIGAGGVQTIRPASPLPQISDPVNVDGTTQPGFAGSPLIVLNGSQAGSFANGLSLMAGNNIVNTVMGFCGYRAEDVP
jgi:hypothetical protein